MDDEKAPWAKRRSKQITTGRPARFRGGRCDAAPASSSRGMDVVDSQVHEGVVPALREIFGPTF